MLLSILAGMMIALGGVVFLSVGGTTGALLFSMGLLTILTLKLELFTGKAGLFATHEIKLGKLAEIWCGNFFGTLAIATGLLFTPRGIVLAEKASEIVAIRVANGIFANFIYGILCGMLMFIAVKTFVVANGQPLYAIMPVAIFILCGFNHCIADMFYLHLGCMQISDYLILIPTTIGNFVGCNLIPASLEYYYSS